MSNSDEVFQLSLTAFAVAPILIDQYHQLHVLIRRQTLQPAASLIRGQRPPQGLAQSIGQALKIAPSSVFNVQSCKRGRIRGSGDYLTEYIAFAGQRLTFKNDETRPVDRLHNGFGHLTWN
ncbi:hypothetical protein D3C75_1141750 [compost metagenome]